MVGLKFDTKIRELVISNGDFALNKLIDAQNGSIILQSRCSFLSSPMIGIGLSDIIGAEKSKEVYELNRWKGQMAQDGAKANYIINPDNTIKLEVKYE